jgi:hypothetical protein
MAIVGRNDQQGEFNGIDAGQHVAHEALMPWHIDETCGDRAAKIGIGEADVDGQTATLLLIQPIGIDARQCAHQAGLAMVDMSCSGDDHR